MDFKTKFDMARRAAGGWFRQRTGAASALYDWVEAAVFSLICVILLFTFIFRVVGVEGPSMNSTLAEGDRLLLLRVYVQPRRGDIVVIDRYAVEPLVKRVIAVEGDTLDILDGRVILNGEILDEPYVQDPTPRNEFQEEILIPEGYVFVMGDNRVNSKDSRSTEIGLVRVADLRGKAVFRFWPLAKFGGLSGKASKEAEVS